MRRPVALHPALSRAAALVHARRRALVLSARALRDTREHVSHVRWPLRCDISVAWTCVCAHGRCRLAPNHGTSMHVCVLLKVICAKVSSIVEICIYNGYCDHFQCTTTYIVTRSWRHKPNCGVSSDKAAQQLRTSWHLQRRSTFLPERLLSSAAGCGRHVRQRSDGKSWSRVYDTATTDAHAASTQVPTGGFCRAPLALLKGACERAWVRGTGGTCGSQNVVCRHRSRGRPRASSASGMTAHASAGPVSATAS